MYTTENEEKSSVVERWNRTIKQRKWKKFKIEGNTQYLHILPEILKQYDDTKNSSIKITPVKASKKKNERIVTSIYMVLRNHYHPNRNLK